MIALIHLVVVLSYVVAALFYGSSLSFQNAKYTKWGRVSLVVAVFVHFGAIGAFCIALKQSPFESGTGTMSVAAWVIALLYLPLDFRNKTPGLGAVVTPVCAGLVFLALLRTGVHTNSDTLLKSGMTSLHVMMVLTSFAMFAIAACCAFFYICQYSLLKRPDKRALFRKLPPLETVDRFAYHLVALAFPLLTVGLILGFASLANKASHETAHLDAHTVVSVFAWAVYMTYLVARTTRGWRGTKPNYLLISGLILTVILYFVPSPIHNFN